MVRMAPSVRPTFIVSSFKIRPTVTPPANEPKACDTITQIRPTADKLLTSSLTPFKEGLNTSMFPKNFAEANVPMVINTKATVRPAITARNFFMVLGRWFTQFNEKVGDFLLSVFCQRQLSSVYGTHHSRRIGKLLEFSGLGITVV